MSRSGLDAPKQKKIVDHAKLSNFATKIKKEIKELEQKLHQNKFKSDDDRINAYIAYFSKRDIIENYINDPDEPHNAQLLAKLENKDETNSNFMDDETIFPFALHNYFFPAICLV